MSDDTWIWQCDHAIPSNTEAGRQAVDEVLHELKSLNCGKHDVFGVHLAMEEALVNAIMHGNRLDADKQVRVRCQISPASIRIEICDEGSGFDPATVPDPTDADRLESPGGRGVMLMKAFMSRVQYNARGNCVVLEKQLGRQSK